jgi:hypothetical protein
MIMFHLISDYTGVTVDMAKIDSFRQEPPAVLHSAHEPGK